MSDLKRHGKGKAGLVLRFLFALILSLSMVLSGIAIPWLDGLNNAYAKDIGYKNSQACDGCEMIRDGKAPSLKDYSSNVAGKHSQQDQRNGLNYDTDGYSTVEKTYDKLLDGAVYAGGNAKSGNQNSNVYFDEDPNDFASVLPFGNTYVDTDKMTWGENSNYTIEIADGAPFKWIAGETYRGRTSKNGLTVEMDPMGDGSGLAKDVAPIIAYVGPIKGYLGNNPEDWRKKSQSSPAEGQQNIIKASDYGASYLYRITYPGAVILKDGTKGNLVIEVDRVEIETTMTQEKALITLQSANQIIMGAGITDKDGNRINKMDFVAKTADEVRDYLEGTSLDDDSWIEDKESKGATGAIIDLNIKITDDNGADAEGNISYAARDMDLENYQSQWGRSIVGEDKYKFNEALTIMDGALSYAVTPYYDHAHETTRATGWIPVRPGSTEKRTSPLHISKPGSGSNANGVRFSAVGNVMLRDKNESFADALIVTKQTGKDAGTEIRTALDKHANNADTESMGVLSQTIPDRIKQQLEGKIMEGGVAVPWNQMTNQQIFDYLGEGSYGDRRADHTTFDTGFAVLMDASGFRLQWSGSMQNQGDVRTTLFDNSVYTYVEQSHGIGGGTYFETYDLENQCSVQRVEGTVIMGRGTDATVTVVPEDGHRVKTIRVGGKGLSNPKTYNIAELTFTDGKYTDTENNVIIEQNSNGTYDVTIPGIKDPRHVHADFTADYYFYKVWKDAAKDGAPKTAPKTTDLTLKATLFDASGTSQGTEETFVVKKADAENAEEPNITQSVEGNDIVWKIKYPAEGYTTKSGQVWPALGIEPDASHSATHDKVRYYWFVTETVNGWKLAKYDNSGAKAPGVVDAAKSREETLVEADKEDLEWAKNAVKDNSTATSTITAKTDAAFLSVFKDGGEIQNEITPPKGTPKETYGAKNTPQTADGKSMFNVTTEKKVSDGSNNEIVKAELLDNEGNPVSEITVEGGKYTIDENGKITFTPDKDFVGTPPAVNVRGTDANGLTAETTYTPHIVDNEKSVTRTITYEYSNGDPVLDSEGNQKTVEHTTTFVAAVDPDTGELTWNGVKDPETGDVIPMESPQTEFPQVDSDPIEGYSPDKDNVSMKDVTPADSDWTEKVIYSPKGVKATPDETYGLPGESQTGTVSFEMETPTYTDGTPNTLTIKLIDPATGEETDEKSVSIPGQGTYTMNDDGTITFTPEDGFTGNPDPVQVTATDRFGTKAGTTYTPHIVDPVDSGTAKRTVHFTYLTEDGKEVTNDVVQELTLKRHATKVDPKTGEVLEWGTWEKKSFPAVKNPDNKVDGRIWTTDDSADALEVTEPGDKGIEYIVYHKEPYTVKYFDGAHGKSNRKGDQSGESYGNEVTGGNGVTPDKGWHFTGKYTYVIKDKYGNVIKTGETDDPTSIEIIGNIEFTPVYKKLPTAIYVDPATGRTIQKTLPFLDDNTEPDPPKDPTRKGYKFTGWKRVVTYDSQGNVESVVYEATWEPLSSSSGSSSGSGAKTGDSIAGLIAAVAALGIALAVIIVMIIRRRRRS